MFTEEDFAKSEDTPCPLCGVPSSAMEDGTPVVCLECGELLAAMYPELS